MKSLKSIELTGQCSPFCISTPRTSVARFRSARLRPSLIYQPNYQHHIAAKLQASSWKLQVIKNFFMVGRWVEGAKLTLENVYIQKCHEYPAFDGLITRPVQETFSPLVIESTPDTSLRRCTVTLKSFRRAWPTRIRPFISSATSFWTARKSFAADNIRRAHYLGKPNKNIFVIVLSI